LGNLRDRSDGAGRNNEKKYEEEAFQLINHQELHCCNSSTAILVQPLFVCRSSRLLVGGNRSKMTGEILQQIIPVCRLASSAPRRFRMVAQGEEQRVRKRRNKRNKRKGFDFMIISVCSVFSVLSLASPITKLCI